MSLFGRIVMQEAAPSLFERVVMESAMPANALAIFYERTPKLLKKKYGIHGAVIDTELSYMVKSGRMATIYMTIGGKPHKLTVQFAGGKWTARLQTKPGTVLRSGTGSKAFLALGAMAPPIKTVKTPALSQLTASPPKPKHVAAPTPTPTAAILKKQQTATVGLYKGKKYRVVAYHHGGNVVELAWFSNPDKSFKIATKKVQITDPPGGPDPKLAPKQATGDGWYRFSTTLVNGKALKDRGVDVVRVTGQDGPPIGGAKRTQRTGGWRDRILVKFHQLSGLKVAGFGDKKTKFHTPPSTVDWELIKNKIDALKGVKAYFHKPKGWHQTALIVKVRA